MEFEWDNKKDLLNTIKHGVTFLEASESFYDPCGIKLIDTAHSINEERFYWIGK